MTGVLGPVLMELGVLAMIEECKLKKKMEPGRKRSVAVSNSNGDVLSNK